MLIFDYQVLLIKFPFVLILIIRCLSREEVLGIGRGTFRPDKSSTVVYIHVFNGSEIHSYILLKSILVGTKKMLVSRRNEDNKRILLESENPATLKSKGEFEKWSVELCNFICKVGYDYIFEYEPVFKVVKDELSVKVEGWEENPGDLKKDGDADDGAFVYDYEERKLLQPHKSFRDPKTKAIESSEMRSRREVIWS